MNEARQGQHQFKKKSALAKLKLRLKEFWKESARVLKVTKRPDKQEFKTIVKISGLGIAVIGLIGFIIHFIRQLLF